MSLENFKKSLGNRLRAVFKKGKMDTSAEKKIDDFCDELGSVIAEETLNYAGSNNNGTTPLTWPNIQNKPLVFPPENHSHPISDITDLSTILSNKSNTSHTHTTTEVTEGSNLYYTTARVDTWWTNIKTLASTFTGLITFDNVLIKRVYFTPITASFAGTYTSDLSLANIFILTMTGNGVLDFSNAQVGAYQWIITTNGHTLTLAVGKFQGEFDVAGKALITGTYDGSKMVIASIKNLTDI
jgi:hypothetical protein